MKVQLLRDTAQGKAGTTIAGPSVWRLAFPAKGCVGKAADREAAGKILADVATTTGATRARLEAAMSAAGTLPKDDDDYNPPRVEASAPAKADPKTEPATSGKK